MRIGVPREIKTDEYRVSLVPAGVESLVKAGHTVLVEKGAGEGSNISDQSYIQAGAQIVNQCEEIFAGSDMIVKVKEPLESEFALAKKGQILFTYFHFAASKPLLEGMKKSGAVCIAYETVTGPNKSLPLLVPMSEVAGRMAIQEGAKYLERPMEGRGIMLAGVPGVAPATVVVIGGGIVGTQAAKMAAGLGAIVYILDINVDRLRYLADIMPPNVITIYSNPINLRELIYQADLVVGAVLIPGAKAPNLITREDLKKMKHRAVFVDVAIDQGGCAETSKPTTHTEPIYIEEDIVHYCVANIPGAVGTTSTYALTNMTFPYVLDIANNGWKKAAQKDTHLREGISVVEGKVTYKPVADALGDEYTPVEEILK